MDAPSYFGAAPTAPPSHPLRRPSEAAPMSFKNAPRVVAGRPSVSDAPPPPQTTPQRTGTLTSAPDDGERGIALHTRRTTAFDTPPESDMAPALLRRPHASDDEGGDVQVQEIVETREQRTQAQLRAFGVAEARRGLIQCTVHRRKAGLLSRDPTHYHMVSERPGESVEFFAIKRPHKPTTNYSIATVDGNFERGTAGFVGKVRANFSGTEFVVYDDGSSPKEGGDLRRELAAVLFEANPLGAVGPRRMKVLLPRLLENDTPTEFRPPFVTDRPSIILEYDVAKSTGTPSERVIVIETKPPQWNETLRVYQANFHNRVHVASIKNFQLCDPHNESRVLLQFGRQDNDGNFALDFQYPFTPLQAFAVAMTVFDNKLLAE